MNNSPLVLSNFSKSYGSHPAVDQVNLAVAEGEVFGFLGPNGSGKSTTIRSILNFISPTGGQITVFGFDSIKDSVKIKLRTGYLAGDVALLEQLTGEQLLHYLANLGRSADSSYIEHLTKLFSATLDRKIHKLSKGNRQKIGIIQAFMHQPDLYVLDEPTSGLDPLMKRVFYELIAELRSKGKTFFISSHDLDEVQKICDRATFVRAGRLIATESIADSSALQVRKFRISFSSAPSIEQYTAIDGVEVNESSSNSITLTMRGPVGPLMQVVASGNPLDFQQESLSLEDTFMHYYN